MHERRRVELNAIRAKFYNVEVDELRVMQSRLLVAIKELRQTELWKRFTTDEKISMRFMNRTPLCHPQNCESCYQTLIFYVNGPTMLLRSLTDTFTTRIHIKQPAHIRARCIQCIDLIMKEENTALNISKHAEALSKE